MDCLEIAHSAWNAIPMKELLQFFSDKASFSNLGLNE